MSSAVSRVDEMQRRVPIVGFPYAVCKRYAEEVPMAAGAAKGAVAGGAYGAAVGSINGRASEGAGTGAISGAAWTMLEADREKQGVVKRCVAGRGYRVLN